MTTKQQQLQQDCTLRGAMKRCHDGLWIVSKADLNLKSGLWAFTFVDVVERKEVFVCEEVESKNAHWVIGEIDDMLPVYSEMFKEVDAIRGGE